VNGNRELERERETKRGEWKQRVRERDKGSKKYKTKSWRETKRDEWKQRDK
jgi:hypothetical protein